MLPESKARGYRPGRYSFNVKGGRCEACEGDGIIKIEMHFMPDVYVTCEVCRGKRYNRETLEIAYKGKTVADVLDMTVDQALSFLENIPAIRQKLSTLSRVGLGSIRLGHAPTAPPAGAGLCAGGGGGGGGGGVGAWCGPPEEVAEEPRSHTGRFLRKVLGGMERRRALARTRRTASAPPRVPGPSRLG